MNCAKIFFASVAFLTFASSASAQDLSLEIARNKYASDIAAIKANISAKTTASCSDRQSMNASLSSAIKNLDLIIAKSKVAKEIETAKSNRNQLSGMLSQANSSFDENCGLGAQKKRENIEIRNRYINEYNNNINAAQNSRNRAFNTNTNNYELCNLLYSERNSLSEAKTDFAVLSGRLTEYADEENEQNKKLLRKIEQNQVDGKAYGCW
ncbi:MAG: hypothetical protein J0L55_12365 [Caulobacterales bacterium]|nr:hypothetical protein [Caulobacterales bacterium]MCA0372107.1 hypothetical protein [Pseudomonadota bacterium]